MTVVCRSCGADDLRVVMDAAAVPVENSTLYGDADSARAVVRGDLRLEVCGRCGFAQNSAFDPALVSYGDGYEAAQGFSPFFQAFSARVIAELIDRYDLKGARAVEIGSGGGDFLREFCEASGGTGLGLDPVIGSEAGTDGNVELRAEAFGPGSGAFAADIVICRHTLEHIAPLGQFLTELRAELAERPDVVLYLEIPDSGRIAGEGAFWDVYYEHCSYLDQVGFRQLLERVGFVVDECRLDYGDQYLVAHARLGEPSAVTGAREEPPSFAAFTDNIDHWRSWARDLNDRGERLAIWAASSKAVAFLAAIPECQPVIAVDINPAKAGRFLPASALAVVHPDGLPAANATVVLAMNPLYVAEIEAELERVGVKATVVPLSG